MQDSLYVLLKGTPPLPLSLCGPYMALIDIYYVAKETAGSISCMYTLLKFKMVYTTCWCLEVYWEIQIPLGPLLAMVCVLVAQAWMVTINRAGYMYSSLVTI